MDGKNLLQSDQSRENLIIPDVDIKNERIRRRKSEWYEKNKERLAEKWSNDPKRKETQKKYYKRNKKKIIGGGGNCLKRGKAGGKGCKKFRSRVSKHGYGGY